jgi:hypothetical protein
VTIIIDVRRVNILKFYCYNIHGLVLFCFILLFLSLTHLMFATQLLVATLDLDNDTIQPSSVACNCELKATHT